MLTHTLCLLRPTCPSCDWRRVSMPGRLTLVSQPSPLQKSSTQLASLIGASSSTLPTPSIYIDSKSTTRKFCSIWTKWSNWVYTGKQLYQHQHFTISLKNEIGYSTVCLVMQKTLNKLVYRWNNITNLGQLSHGGGRGNPALWLLVHLIMISQERMLCEAQSSVPWGWMTWSCPCRCACARRPRCARSSTRPPAARRTSCWSAARSEIFNIIQ